MEQFHLHSELIQYIKRIINNFSTPLVNIILDKNNKLRHVYKILGTNFAHETIKTIFHPSNLRLRVARK